MAQLRYKTQKFCKTNSDRKRPKTIDFPSEVEDLQSNTKHLDKKQFESGLQTFQDYVNQSGVLANIDVAMEIFGQIECNTFDILDMEQKSIGAAIFLRASMFNHSCEPNCVAVFDGNVVDLRTIMEVPANQECVISYCELLAPMHERQTKLKDQFHFTCACSRCHKQQVEDFEMANGAPGCNLSQAEKGKFEMANGAPCCNLSQAEEDSRTKESTDQEERSELETQSLDMLKRVATLSSEGNFSDGIEMCTSYLAQHRSIFPQHHYIIVRTLDSLVDLYIQLGEHQRAADLGDEIIEAYRLHYPVNYPSIAWQLRKVALIRCLQEDGPKEGLERAIKLIKEAKQIFLVSHGEEHPLVADCGNLLENWTSTYQDWQKEDS